MTQDPKSTPVPPMPDVPPGALKVAVVGDSIAANLGQGLRILAKSRGDLAAYNLAVPGCPMTIGRQRRLGPDAPFDVDPACEWWADPTSDRRKALEAFDPDVIVTQAGINEVLERKLPNWDDWRGPSDPRFDGWVVDQYREAVSLWQANGARVVVTSSPCADWGRYDAFKDIEDPDRRVTDLNARAYAQVSGVVVADLFQRVCPEGRYQADVEGVQDGRYDGFHFTPEASAALAEHWLAPIVFAVGRPVGAS
jgi:hypothetical protein